MPPIRLEDRQPQVEDLDLAVRRQHQVRRLDVAVDQPALVGRTQPDRNLADDLAGVGHGQRADAIDDLRQVEPLDVFHDQVVAALGLAGVHGANDVRMVELPDGLHFPLETGDPLRILGQAGGENLDGDQLAELPVPGFIDGAHASLAQNLQQVVLQEAARTGQRRRKGRWGLGSLIVAGNCPREQRSTTWRHSGSSP